MQFKPLKTGDTDITITDHSGNSYILRLQVRYESITYTVTSVSAEVEGDKMQVGEQRALKEIIINDIPVQKDGSYTLQYTNDTYTQGSITIRSSASTLQRQGIFYRTEKESAAGFHYYSLNITLTTGENLIYSLVEKEENGTSEIYLTADVTADYKGSYPLLEKAVTYQYLEKTSSIPATE